MTATNSMLIRRSTDTEDEQSLAVAISVDSSLEQLARHLTTLPDALGHLTRPQIMVAVVGAPIALQITGFGATVNLDNFTFGHAGACHELTAYFLARHTSIDCYEKHGRKGHAIIITGHKPGRHVNPTHVRDIIGDTLRRPMPVRDVYADLQSRYDLHVLIPADTPDAAAITNAWVRLLGTAAVIRLDPPDAVVTTIATLVS